MALKCTNPKCRNHDNDSVTNMDFRGVQELHPQTIEEAASGAERKARGPERFFCYACGKEASGKLNEETDDDEDALLPAPPTRPLKSGDDAPEKKEG